MEPQRRRIDQLERTMGINGNRRMTRPFKRERREETGITLRGELPTVDHTVNIRGEVIETVTGYQSVVTTVMVLVI